MINTYMKEQKDLINSGKDFEDFDNYDFGKDIWVLFVYTVVTRI